MPIVHARCRAARVALLAAVTAGAVTALLGRPSVAAAEETYPIKLDRPFVVGQDYAVAAKGQTDQMVKVTVNGQPQPDKAEKYAAELTGTAKVLAINAKTGGPTKLALTVEKLTKDGTDVFPAGTVITVDHGGAKTTYMVDGKPVEAEQAGVLELLVDVDKADKVVSEDAMFGTPKPQPVGGQWDADVAKMVDDMKGDEIPVSAEHLKATTKLVKVDGTGGQAMETVETTFAADPLEAGQVMNGLTVTGGSLSGTVTQIMPADAAVAKAGQDLHMTVKMTGTAGGGVAVAEISMERSVHRTMTPKK